MNIRILAASALAFAILVPAANAATPNHIQSAQNHGSGTDSCPGGNQNLGTTLCVPFRAKVVHARAIKHVAKPVAAFS
jgi:hypothetical protein